MAAGIDIDRWGEAFDVGGLSYPSANPVLIDGEDTDILFAKMVAVFAGMLKHGRLIFALGVGGG